MSKYAWFIVGDTDSGETSDRTGRVGPRSASGVWKLRDVLGSGVQFRMSDATGRVRFTGYLAGEFTGNEPLDEFGSEKGCTRIEIQRGEDWEEPAAG